MKIGIDKKLLQLEIIYMHRYKYNRMIKDDIIGRGGWVSNVGKVWLLFHILYIKNKANFFKLISETYQYNYSNMISTIKYLNWWSLSKVMIIHSFICEMVVWAGMVVWGGHSGNPKSRNTNFHPIFIIIIIFIEQ